MKIFLATALLLAYKLCAAQIPGDVIEKKCDSIFNIYDGKPGVAVLIVQDGKIAFEKGYGLANLEYHIAITPTTVFDIASCSKQFTGYAISTLIQQGKISSDDDIHKYLPDVPEFGKKITIGNLVHHTSGLRDWPEGLHAAGWRWDEAFAWDDVMRMVKQQKELDFEPGSRYSYSNTGYNLLAAIVEKVTGKRLPVWLDENIFKPLQMNSSQELTDYSKVIKNVAGSYYSDTDGFHKSFDMLTAWGSSCIFTTTEDLAKWVIAFKKGLDNNDPVYSRMIETDTLNNGEKNTYAYGNGVTDDRGLINIKHTGGWANFASVISTYPGEKISIILLSNNGSFDYGSANKVAHTLFDSKFKRDSVIKPLDLASKPTVKLDASILQKYKNTYKLRDGWSVTFTLEDGKLMVQSTGEAKFPTEPKSDTVIWVPAYSSAFTFSDTDKANTVKYHNIIAKRITPIKVDISKYAGYAGNYYSAELETTYRVYTDRGKLMMHHMRLGDFELAPDLETEGIFSGNVGKMVFEKDAQGKVIGFKLSGGRITNIQFEKV